MLHLYDLHNSKLICHFIWSLFCPRVQMLVLLIQSSVHCTLWVNRISGIFVAVSATIHKIIHGWHDYIVYLIFIGDKDKIHHAQYTIYMFVQYRSPWILCILLCMGFTVLHSEHSLLRAVVAHSTFSQSFIHKNCFHQYAIFITTFSLYLTLLPLLLLLPEFFHCRIYIKIYWNIPHL